MQQVPHHDTMMQYFEWYLPSDCALWQQVAHEASSLAQAGFNQLWLPPAYKGTGGIHDCGYGVYDLYDLGEFNAKGTVRTKYGTKDEYIEAVKALHRHHIQAIADIVLNHHIGADDTQSIQVRTVNQDDQRQVASKPFSYRAPTKFTFPSRHGTYSDFVWDWHDFTGCSDQDRSGNRRVMLFDGKQWNRNVSDERGNFDYVLGVDVDFSSQRVRDELIRWGKWFIETTDVDGFRLDAVKHIDSTFFPEWLATMRSLGDKSWFAVGEYWGYDAPTLLQYIHDTQESMAVFDVPLHLKFHDASIWAPNFNLQSLFEESLAVQAPDYACVFVDNHDTQPGQSLESWVNAWFKPLAYAFILLRDFTHPCVFYGDWYGIPHDNIAPIAELPMMVRIRRYLLGSTVRDMPSRDHRDLCWLVEGEHPVIVVMSTQDDVHHHLQHEDLRNATLVDAVHPDHTVQANADGEVDVNCAGCSVSVYIRTEDMALLK